MTTLEPAAWETGQRLNLNYIIPSVFDPGITKVVARAIVRQEED